MQQNPIYQGNRYTPAQAPQGNVSPNLPFADAWQRNYAAMTRHTERMQEALVERVDKTALLNQEAEARNNDLEMTLEMRQMLDLPNGQGGFYDKNGMVDKAAVRSFANKYLTRSRNWHKALISPEAKEKSVQGTRDYQFGIVKALESAIVANTKDRQIKAFNANVNLAAKMNDWDAIQNYAEAAEKDRIISEVQANTILFDNEKNRINDDVIAVGSIDEALDLLENDDWVAGAEYYDPNAIEKLKRKIDSFSKIEGQAETFAVTIDPVTGKPVRTKKAAVPPETAPWYHQLHFIKFGGDFKSPQAQNEGFKIMQRYAAENITKPKGTAEGDAQWADLRAMGGSIGIADTELEEIHKTRISQLSYGGFDPKAYLDSVPAEIWLRNTTKDDAILADEETTDTQKAASLRRLVEEMKDAVMAQYNSWYSQNKNHKPTARAQAAEFEKHFQKMLKDSPAIFHALTAQINDNILKQEMAIDKELRATAKRQKDTAVENTRWKENAAKKLAELGITVSPVNATNPGARISTDLKMDIELGAEPAIKEDPSYKNECIIFIPETMKTGFDQITLPTGKNKCKTFLVRKANIKKPALSRKAKIALGVATRNPDRITWDGNKLTISTNDIPRVNFGLFPEDDEMEEATPVSDVETSDGLAPDDFTEEELNLY